MKINWEKLKSIISNNNSFLLSTHENPDGDGLGSEVAMYYYLKAQDKECRIINISNYTDNYQFLDSDSIIEKYNESDHKKWISECDCAIIFDIGDYKRLREISNVLSKYDVYKISIDHHPSDDTFFNYRFLDIFSPATGYMVWQYFKFIDFKLTYDISQGLYAALITDTGSFRYNSTTSDCHIMAKEILDTGVKPYDVYSQIYEQRTIGQINLLSEAINSLEIIDEFACINITQKMLNNCNCTLKDVDGFTDMMRGIKGVEVSFMISEMINNNFKISFRSRGKYIINDIAHFFGGGGHKLAAGATVDDSSYEEIKSTILKMLNNKKVELCQ